MFHGIGWKKNLRRLERTARSRKELPLRLQRATAQIQLRASGDVITGRVFLHDLTASKVNLFLSQPVASGEEVFFVLEQPRHFFVRGRISWCGLYRLNTRVITPENLQYRASVRFEFESAEDRMLVERYLNELIVP